MISGNAANTFEQEMRKADVFMGKSFMFHVINSKLQTIDDFMQILVSSIKSNRTRLLVDKYLS